MECFVEKVIGAELIRNEHSSAPPLTNDNIRIDSSSTILIDPPSSPKLSSIASSLSPDISMLCQFFLHIHQSLSQQTRLALPLDPERTDIVFARLMVALVEHFVASGDLILPNTSPIEQEPFFAGLYPQISETEVTPLDTFYLHNLALLFSQIVHHPDNRHRFVPSNRLLLCGDAVESSEHIRNAVKQVKKAHSLETVRNAYYDWEEWMIMMEIVKQGVASLTDISFLQSRCFRATLLSLQTKHQHIVNPPPIEENSDSRISDHRFWAELDSAVHYTPPFVDRNEKFDISLFDETDDAKVVASLRRCYAVVKATQSTECIADVDTFRTSLISALHSTNSVIQIECSNLFFTTGVVLQIFDDPREKCFDSLRTAFRDGTLWEKIVLLKLWVGGIDFQDKRGLGLKLDESDFDFDGFLAADMSDVQLFDNVCVFLERFLFNRAASITFPGRLDFVLKFEKKYQMMSRLSGESNPFSEQKRSRHFQRPLAIFLSSVLSFYRGCNFPTAMTKLFTTDFVFSPFSSYDRLCPAFLLNHTSIAPKHLRSFFPMDLMFERHLRDDPNGFFEGWTDLSNCTPRRFLHTPYVGLHSLLLRMSGQETTQVDILKLFCCFPPPRLFDTLLSSPSLIRATRKTWTGVLSIVRDFGESIAPFGACSSLAKVFKMLAPFDLNPSQLELNLVCRVGEIVVSLHWLGIPPHFDSPLLCHLPSLAGAQRGALPTLSSHSGIPSLVAPHNIQHDVDSIRTKLSAKLSFGKAVQILCHCGRLVTSDRMTSLLSLYLSFSFLNDRHPNRSLFLVGHNAPGLVSIVFEFFYRLVHATSDVIRIELVKRGLLDRVVFAVSTSSFLDDYNKGIAVIGILLSTLRRVDQKERVSTFNFSTLF
ncbi:hypothetical protein BLNAU_13560 [Blattamonas nauphoetae]|uniref:Uncharacterized protein n=1 Tax=Blattamonas nauphoetae TaxID=2049346 RepID=A0ABQ9XGF2_9EUKA|nr:hypothetical protein BLNAU_13560 [Blattamonas nauphoetae]